LEYTGEYVLDKIRKEKEKKDKEEQQKLEQKKMKDKVEQIHSNTTND